MFCNRCGYEYNGNFCPKCGAKAKNAEAQQENTQENPYYSYYAENPSQSQAQPYAYAPPVKPVKTTSTATVILTVIITIVLLFLLVFVAPISCISCLSEGDFSSFSTEVDEKIYRTGETATSKEFSYTVTNVEVIDKFESSKPREGMNFIMVDYKVTNIIDTPEYMDFEITCYSDDEILCDEIVPDEFYYNYSEILPKKSYKASSVYSVPEDADSVQIYIRDTYMTYKYQIK